MQLLYNIIHFIILKNVSRSRHKNMFKVFALMNLFQLLLQV